MLDINWRVSVAFCDLKHDCANIFTSHYSDFQFQRPAVFETVVIFHQYTENVGIFHWFPRLT